MSSVTAWMRASAIAAIMSLAAGPGTAFAQEQATMGGQMPPGGQGGPMMCGLNEHIDAELAYLKTVLKITETQAPQWNVFAEAFRADREKKESLCKDAMEQARAMKSASLIDSLTMVEDQLAERLESLRAMKAAVQPLYAILSKEQKKTADEMMKGGQNF